MPLLLFWTFLYLKLQMEKSVQYQSINTYSTLNELSDKTKNIWFVFHGMAYLSRYFIQYFKDLNPEENYIVALQAPSKYYQDKKFKHIGASWLTRENTKVETTNVLNYVNAVFDAEYVEGKNIILMGYSQGVSIATRWFAHRKLPIHALLLHSGGLPIELEAKDFKFIEDFKNDFKLWVVYGNQDPYINEERAEKEKVLANKMFEGLYEIKVFEGVHEVNREMLKEFVEER